MGIRWAMGSVSVQEIPTIHLRATQKRMSKPVSAFISYLTDSLGLHIFSAHFF